MCLLHNRVNIRVTAKDAHLCQIILCWYQYIQTAGVDDAISSYGHAMGSDKIQIATYLIAKDFTLQSIDCTANIDLAVDKIYQVVYFAAILVSFKIHIGNIAISNIKICKTIYGQVFICIH